MPRPLAAILTLGCKLNLADSEEIARGLRGAGYDVVDQLCEAQAYVVNTCSVTHVADRKARRLIRSVQRLNPGAPVAVTGCFPQTAGKAAVEGLGAGLVVGTRDTDKRRLVTWLAEKAGHGWPARDAGGGLHTRAFIKAQEGCNDVCAFCIVPRTRGREESRSISRVLAEVDRAVAAGAREVVITGTQLGAWGRDLDPPLKPHHLIAGILEGCEVGRVRFSSLQPQDISPELLGLWSDPRLMPHFHLALQSGSEAVLRTMRRRYTAAQFIDAAARIRAVSPDAAITTDVIAGFPGEKAEDFEATLALCEEVEFARIHAFPYSRRTGTTAARMPEQVPEPERRARMAGLLALGDRLSKAFRARFEGAVRPALWEAQRGSPLGPLAVGLTDNYIRVFARGEGLQNRVTPVRIGVPYDDGVLGTLTGGDE